MDSDCIRKGTDIRTKESYRIHLLKNRQENLSYYAVGVDMLPRLVFQLKRFSQSKKDNR